MGLILIFSLNKFYEFAKIKNLKVDFLFDEISEDNNYKGFGDFHKVPHKTYLHLLGVFKRNASICKSMEVYIMKYFSESYSKITKLINEIEGNQNEIEFLTVVKISELIAEFDNELKTNEFSTENFLLKRDLYNEGLPNNLENFLIEKLDFTIVLLTGFQKKITTINKEEFLFLEIFELNTTPRTYKLDEIDEIILTELSDPIQYFDFTSRMNVYFDDEDEDSKTEFLTLLNGRLLNYIVLKIISIYK
jgi:hypothetical protein